MGIDHSRRITFEEVADLYNETRSSYPDELVEDIIRLSALEPGDHILEIGCGPGNATVLFARKGYPLLGIELGEKLAAYARERCKSYPNTLIVQSAFEEYELSPHRFDLAISADAFHWIPPDIGYPKVMKALKATGSIAFFWHVPVDPKTAWSRAIDEIFQKRAPQFENPQQSFTLEWLVDIVRKNYREFCGIEKVTVKVYNWSETLSADQFINLMRTYSSHREMSEEVRQGLYADIRKVIHELGGEVAQPYQVALFYAKVKQDG